MCLAPATLAVRIPAKPQNPNSHRTFSGRGCRIPRTGHGGSSEATPAEGGRHLAAGAPQPRRAELRRLRNRLRRLRNRLRGVPAFELPARLHLAILVVPNYVGPKLLKFLRGTTSLDVVYIDTDESFAFRKQTSYIQFKHYTPFRKRHDIYVF